MQSAELEMRVLASIQAISSHNVGEDDLIEFKRAWPDAEKEKFVRQLAGSLNRAGGETVVLVIGIDEKTGAHCSWTGVEVNNWWPSVQKHFDQAMPEIVRDLMIDVGEGKMVRALAIASDRVPYVLKTSNGSSSREIPIREGTGTQSASRDQLLRMLVPAVNIPKIDILRVGVTFLEDYGDPNPDSADDGGMFFSGWADIFVEHTFSRSSVMFPRHRISGAAIAAGLTTPLTASRIGSSVNDVTHGVAGIVEIPDGFVVNGPGTMRVRFRSGPMDWQACKEAHASDDLRLVLDLPVSGTNRSVHIEQVLQKNDAAMESRGGSRELLAHWSYAF